MGPLTSFHQRVWVWVASKRKAGFTSIKVPSPCVERVLSIPSESLNELQRQVGGVMRLATLPSLCVCLTKRNRIAGGDSCHHPLNSLVCVHSAAPPTHTTDLLTVKDAVLPPLCVLHVGGDMASGCQRCVTTSACNGWLFPFLFVVVALSTQLVGWGRVAMDCDAVAMLYAP